MKQSKEDWWNDSDKENQSTRGKNVAESISLPRISQELSWDRTRPLQLKQHSKHFPSRLPKKNI
jgi:hypothetical protein